MATITTDTFLDGGVARTAGETWTVNGCTLTMRTDTRVHANAPAGMTGSLGQTSTSNILGGTIFFDASAVRWMAFDTGAGTVPAIGTTITQGGVTGYLLGVWENYTSAPTAIGAAMPATGFLKFREVAGGTYSVGALTGISANASSPDVTGWIEIVIDTGVTLGLSGNSSSSLVKSRGEWFYLDSTTGVTGQQLQIPTNGGGAGTTVQAIQIEISPGSDTYEWYPVIGATFAAASMPTDARGKFVQHMGSGLVRIGNDGTTDMGFTPISGCKIRVPNIFGRTCATASRSANLLASTSITSRVRWNGLYRLDIEYLSSDWYCTFSTSSSIILKNFVFDTSMTLSNMIGPVVFDNCANGCPQTIASAVAINTTTNFNGISISNSKFCGTSSATVLSFNTVDGVILSNVYVATTWARVSAARCYYFISCTNIALSSVNSINGRYDFASSSKITANNLDYIDRLFGNTTSAGASNAMSFTNIVDCVINGISFGFGGAINNCHPYNALISSDTNTNLRVRNAGTLLSPLNCGSNSSLFPANVVNIIGREIDCKYQRLYLTGTRSSTVLFSITGNNTLVEYVYGNSGTQISNLPSNSIIRNSKFGNTTNISSQNIGLNFNTGYTTDTSGFIQILAISLSAYSAPYVTTNFLGVDGFIGQNGVLLRTIGSYIIFESPYLLTGYTGFSNVNPTYAGGVTVTSTNNVSKTYQIDTGSGYSGVWADFTGANLAAESITSTGFKIKFKLQCVISSDTNTFTHVKKDLNTTLTAQSENMYPLDTAQLGFTNLVPGSEVRVFTGTNPSTSVEIGGIESTAGSTFSFSHSSGGVEGVIAIFALGYQPIYLPYTFKSTDDSILIQQTVDRNYVNP